MFHYLEDERRESKKSRRASEDTAAGKKYTYQCMAKVISSILIFGSYPSSGPFFAYIHQEREHVLKARSTVNQTDEKAQKLAQLRLKNIEEKKRRYVTEVRKRESCECALSSLLYTHLLIHTLPYAMII